MLTFDHFDSQDEFDSQAEIDYEEELDKLKEALFEICKTEFNRSSALNRLIKEHGPLVVDVFDDDPFEVMSQLDDFYECNDYTDPETGEWRTFEEWAEYFESQCREQLSHIVWNYFRDKLTLDAAFEKLKEEHAELIKSLSINSLSYFEQFVEDQNVENEVLGYEMTLSEWLDLFQNDKYELYDTCMYLVEEKNQLREKIESIQNIVK